MELPDVPATMSERNSSLDQTIARERTRLGKFIRRRVRDPTEAEDILQDVFHRFVEAYRLPEPIEQASAWLFRVARNRIVDLFRRRESRSDGEFVEDPRAENEYRLDLALPSPDLGPEAAYARSVLLKSLLQALSELPPDQRDVFVGHELEGRSFKDMAAQSGVSVNTLLARKRYAVLDLRERLQSVYDELEF
jgi:RNA polymerase sigma factor (sigma-70 family)